jgi:hypothetical protein
MRDQTCNKFRKLTDFLPYLLPRKSPRRWPDHCTFHQPPPLYSLSTEISYHLILIVGYGYRPISPMYEIGLHLGLFYQKTVHLRQGRNQCKNVERRPRSFKKTVISFSLPPCMQQTHHNEFINHISPPAAL